MELKHLIFIFSPIFEWEKPIIRRLVQKLLDSCSAILCLVIACDII